MVAASAPEQGPAVTVEYRELPKESKAQLEKVLQEWVVWHGRSFSGRMAVPVSAALLSGSLEFAPSLLMSPGASACALAWVDKPAATPSQTGALPGSRLGFNLSYEMVGDVPKYDCATEQPLDAKGAERVAQAELNDRWLGLTENGTPSCSARRDSGHYAAAAGRVRQRCFNCGSYLHSMKDCLRQRDEAAIRKARQEHPGSNRAPMGAPKRYFLQASGAEQGGEFEGLRPGALSGELLDALGLKHTDPPPWLQRMRQLGYPPGYREGSRGDVDAADDILVLYDDEDSESPLKATGKADGEAVAHGSGINAEAKEPFGVEHDSGSSVEKGAETVSFPGINAPIPAGADPNAWDVQQLHEVAGNVMDLEDRGLKRPMARQNSETHQAMKRPRLSTEYMPAAQMPAMQYPFLKGFNQVLDQPQPHQSLAPAVSQSYQPHMSAPPSYWPAQMQQPAYTGWAQPPGQTGPIWAAPCHFGLPQPAQSWAASSWPQHAQPQATHQYTAPQQWHTHTQHHPTQQEATPRYAATHESPQLHLPQAGGGYPGSPAAIASFGNAWPALAGAAAPATPLASHIGGGFPAAAWHFPRQPPSVEQPYQTGGAHPSGNTEVAGSAFTGSITQPPLAAEYPPYPGGSNHLQWNWNAGTSKGVGAHMPYVEDSEPPPPPPP